MTISYAIRSLARRTTFKLFYFDAFQLISDKFRVTGGVNTEYLEEAYESFVVALDKVFARKLRDEVLLISIIVELINAASERARKLPGSTKLVVYRVSNGAVVTLGIEHKVQQYSQEITALVFGTTMYSLLIGQLTGKEPSCKLTSDGAIEAARKLRKHRTNNKEFRRALFPKAARTK